MKVYLFYKEDTVIENGNEISVKGLPRLIKGNEMLIFDTIEERDAYVESITPAPVWTKEAYVAEVNRLHEDLFAQYYTQRDYQSREEIALWVNHPQYGGEATALIAWYWITWDLIKAHEAQATEATADVQAFINSLPTFVYG